MMKKLVWRLGKLPTVLELSELLRTEIITKDEAREILFNTEDQEDRDKKSLQDEIKFLRELVQSLSKRDNTRIVEVIKEIEVPYRRYPWHGHYEYWYTDGATSGLNTNIMLCATDTALGNSMTTMATANTSNFSEIKTF